MKLLTLIAVGMTLYYVITAEPLRQAKQMIPIADYHQLFNDPSLNNHYGVIRHYGTRPVSSEQQIFFRTNNNQNSGSEVVSTRDVPAAEQLGRFYLGGNIGFALPTVNNNILIKTSYAFTTATGTVCKVTTCIPSTLFTGAAAMGYESASVICRKRREVLELFGETVKVQPSTVQPTMTVTTILDAGFKPVPEERQMEMSPYPVMLESSLDDPSDPEKPRTKRFAFILTTTLTSYSLATTTYTITIRPAGAESLTCRPAAYGICNV